MMRLFPHFLAIFWFLLVPVSHTVAGDEADLYWPQWRGPLGTGVAPYGTPPIEWSETKNIRWVTPLPGSGHSTPITWDNRIFVTTSVPFGDSVEPVYNRAPGAHDNYPVSQGHEFVVLAISRDDGEILWQRTVRKEFPHEGGHYTGSLASNSPVTDGEHLYAFFGSRGLFCLDMEGNPIWEKDLGRMQTLHAHGEGSSPVLHGDKLIINWDHEGDSFLVALNKHTGKQIWKVPRDEITSWSTPLIVEHAGKPQVIVSATMRVRGYDLATGTLIWECGGLTSNVVSSPVAADGMVYVASSYGKQAMLAIRLEGAKGDITGTGQVAWTLKKHTPYVPSPLLYENRLYFLRHLQGILTCLNAKTGEKLYGPHRLEGMYDVFSSPVAAAGRVYITDQNGTTLVIKHGDVPEILARNHLNDSFSASPAVAGNDLYLRGSSLYCISED